MATTPSAFKSAEQARRSCVTWRRRATRSLSMMLWTVDGATPSSPRVSAVAGTASPIMKIMLGDLIVVGSTWVLGRAGLCCALRVLKKPRQKQPLASFAVEIW